MSVFIMRTWIAYLFFVTITSWAAASSEIVQQTGGLRASASASAFAQDISNAVSAALGCGGQVSVDHLTKIEERLKPVWAALPKNSGGRIEKRMLRYITYRYFMQKSALVLRGFETARPATSSDWAPADVLSRTIPGFVESVLQSKHTEQQGFGLSDVAYMVAALEQLVFDSETALLQASYEAKGMSSYEASLSEVDLKNVLEEYIMYWLIGDNPDGRKMLAAGRNVVTQAIPHWGLLSKFVYGQLVTFRFNRQRAGRGSSALSRMYTFDDAHKVVGEITRTFSSFWLSECSWMENALAKLDTHGTGRVPLARFYSFGLGGEWRFGESEQYLRELGVLDESSARHGKQVIIPNYIQSASNCVVSHAHYLICCTNRCEDMLGDMEAAVGKPVAEPSLIWELVSNASKQTWQGTEYDHDHGTHLPNSLRDQLNRIADANSGQVPLHGRLFSQWLHFAFPRECPFPQKAGSASMVTPNDFGQSYTATHHEMRSHVDNHSSFPVEVNKDDQQWMSQWSTEEELLADYGNHLRAPWDKGMALMSIGTLVVFVFVAVLLSTGAIVTGGTSASGGSFLPTHSKVHSI